MIKLFAYNTGSFSSALQAKSENGLYFINEFDTLDDLASHHKTCSALIHCIGNSQIEIVRELENGEFTAAFAPSNINPTVLNTLYSVVGVTEWDNDCENIWRGEIYHPSPFESSVFLSRLPTDSVAGTVLSLYSDSLSNCYFFYTGKVWEYRQK